MFCTAETFGYVYSIYTADILANTAQLWVKPQTRPGLARPTSLKTILARPKIWSGQEDVKSRRR